MSPFQPWQKPEGVLTRLLRCVENGRLFPLDDIEGCDKFSVLDIDIFFIIWYSKALIDDFDDMFFVCHGPIVTTCQVFERILGRSPSACRREAICMSRRMVRSSEVSNHWQTYSVARRMSAE